MVLQNYTHRTKPTEYILQQNKEIRRQTLPLPKQPQKTPCTPSKRKTE